MNAHYASKVLEEMSSDNAVDILNELSKPKVASLLTLMNRDDANEIKHLLHYEEDTAGGIMTTEYISLDVNTPVKSINVSKRTSTRCRNDLCYFWH